MVCRNFVPIEGSSMGLDVSEHMKTTDFNEIMETLDNLEAGEKFPFVSTVHGFRLSDLTKEDGNRLPGVVNKVLKESKSPSIADVCRFEDFRIMDREEHHDCDAEGFLTARKVASATGV